MALYSVIDLSRWKFTDDLILVLDIAVAEGCIDKVSMFPTWLPSYLLLLLGVV